MKTLRSFRFVTIREGPDLRLFSHASILTRLALWLIDATRDKVTRAAEARRKTPAHPIVLACLDEESDTFLIVGISGAPEFGDVRKKLVASRLQFNERRKLTRRDLPPVVSVWPFSLQRRTRERTLVTTCLTLA